MAASLLKEKQLSFWSSLINQNQSLKLPTDFPRTMMDENETNSNTILQYEQLKEIISLDDVLSSQSFKDKFLQVTDSEAQKSFTRNTFVLSVFALLLARYTYEETFLIGILQDENTERDSFIVSANIPMPSADEDTFEGISREKSTTEYSFKKLLSNIQGAFSDSVGNLSQFGNVQNILSEVEQKQGKVDTTLLVQVSFSSYDGPYNLVNASSSPFPISNVDLHLHLDTKTNQVSISYQTNLFTELRMQDMLNQLKLAAKQLVSEPIQSIFDVSLVTEYAKTVLPHPDKPLNNDFYGAIHEVFQEQAKKIPQRITMVDSKESVTYETLNKLSNQLARQLLANGLKRQEVVTIFGHRSCPVVLAILATLKCAAVFNMLDPAYPADRIITCLEVSSPSAVILIEASGPLPKEVVKYIQTKSTVRFVVSLKSITESVSEQIYADYADTDLSSDPEWRDKVQITQDDFAVCTYTSGSTGIPKGVLGRHGPLTHYYPWMKQRFNLSENDVFSMQSGISHDPLQRDISTPWFLGCTMYIPTNEDIVNPGRLAEWFEEKKITVSCLTPAMGQLLTSAASIATTSTGEPLKLNHLRYAFFVGDVLSKKFVKRLCDISPIVRVINLYGSTETQRSVTYYMVPRPGEKCMETGIPFERLKDIIPIGRGMLDVQALTLSRFTSRDDKFMLCGIGEMGEIYMRSPHLSQGYKGKEKDTREKFIPNPFLTTGYIDRMYRTGDLGRYLISGDAECSGRADDQIKIRGFRIELGEINTALNSHELVKESVTIVREDCVPGTNEKRIVTYFVLDKVEIEKSTIYGNYFTMESGLRASIIKTIIKDLRQYLRSKLPDYMIPSYFVPLDKIPLTPNGKIKKQDLPRPETSASTSTDQRQDEETYVAPRNDLEQQLVTIWGEILQGSSGQGIGIHDNFFDLGGHSINATTLTLKIRQQVEGASKLPVELLFKAPTVSALAVAIEQLRRTFLLADFLKKTSARIYCLVRADNEEKARKRILESLLSYHFLWTSKEMDQQEERESMNLVNKMNLAEIVEGRIIPVLGDLTKPYLGLSPIKFEELSDTIDVIIHNGAAVHWLYSYEKLKAPNVNGTREILKMACGGKKLTPVHYVSTTSVFDSEQYKEFTDVYEDSSLPYHEDLTGYPQSKYVAEKLCMNARMRGLPVCIYRPGYITGHSKTGVWNPDDFLCRMIKGCIQMGYYPDMPTSKLDMSPVDFISGAIVYLSRTMDSVVKHQAYHLVNPHEFFFNSLFETGRKLGFKLLPLPFKEWKEKLYQQTVEKKELSTGEEENVLYPLVTYFTDDYDLKMTAKRPWYDNTHTLEGLENSGVTCPKVIELMTTYYHFLCKCGFLVPPEEPTELAKKFGFHKIPANIQRNPKTSMSSLDLSVIHSDVNSTFNESPSPTSFNYQSLMRNNRLQ
ncbi:hypothetical protein FDP41_005596 [Naegleria fowleri]|uniref:Carrier domain-containing protein n=2 Tax=Naegleria fowleri TaxID=5763 RepID=A0A6A5BL65_NAEFO|nr:uncharacterized protein FDP41_005596 [Naegleria fowleri]KAF0975602.1 hypothetical protein FDP41_005596 [Naegleria fowleri]